ncbi:MAG TPA: CHAT domain-containing protein, partial [Pyrinomonadaceae bacterium]
NNLDVLKAIKDILLNCPTKHLTRQKPPHTEKDRSTNTLNRSLKSNDDVRQAEIVAHKIREIASEVMREREIENRSVSVSSTNVAVPISPGEAAVKRKSEEQDEKDIKKIRNRGKEQGLTQALVYDAEKKLLRSLLGGDLDKPENPRFVRGKRAARKKEVKDENKTLIKVRLRLAKIEKTQAPVIVVGQYQDLPPKGSVGAVDRKIGDLISLAHQNNMFGAGLGEIFVIPISNKKAAEAKTGEKPTIYLSELVEVVLVAGMGQFNSFNRDALRYLMLNVVLSVLKFGYEKIATVLIGSNLSRYTTERATISLFEGVADALRRLPKAAGKGIELEIYEIDEARAESAGETIKDLKTGKIADEDLNNIVLEFNGLEKDPELADNKNSGRGAKANPVEEITRLTFKRENGSFHLSALTASAAIPERRVPVKNFVVETLIEELRMPKSIEEQIRFGRLLHILAIPEEFQGYVDSNQTLVLLLNREAAAIPWELVKYGGKTSTKSFGIDLRLTRQFVSADAPIPGVAPPLNSEFKALIIADPAEDVNLRLPGARMEGEQLRAFFEKLRKKHRKLLDAGQPAIDFQMDYRIGYEQCDVVEILSLIATEEYDLVHFAGHGIFNEKTPNQSGWIFGRDAKTEELIILSAQEIFPLRRIPRIVFSNACFSAQLGSTKMCEKVPTFESNKSLAGLAEAFFLHGIENYIGTGWQVNDIYAINFAKKFYEEALDSELSADKISTLGEALSRARETVNNQTTKLQVLDSSWGAYQHYGNPNDRLVVLESKQDDPQ